MTAVLFVVCAVLPVATIFIALRRSLGRGAANAILAAGLAIGLGMGLAGASFSMWRFLAPQAWFDAYPFVDAAIWAVLAVIAYRMEQAPTVGPSSEGLLRSHGLLIAAFAAVLLMSLAFFTLHTVRLPHGEWDAWAIWNLRARFLVRGGEHWRDLFTTAIPHPGYPHLIPAAVARLWTWIASEATAAAAAVAASFTYAIPIVLVGAVARLKGWPAGLWAGLLVVAATLLTFVGVQQVADVPFAYFTLAVIVLLALDSGEARTRRFMFLAGAALGLAGLVKDEGLPLMLGVTIAVVAYQLCLRRAPLRDRLLRTFGFLLAGLPFWWLLLLIHLAAPNVGLAQAFADESVLTKVMSLDRHLMIGKAFVSTLWGWSVVPAIGAGPLFVVACLLGGWGLDRRHRAAFGFAAAAMVLMAGSYYAAFLVTPYELSWHLLSLQRVLVHLWPTFVLAFCLAVSFDPDRTSGGATRTAAERIQ